jgi:hemerythrin
VEFLKDYALRHFQAEEELMAKHGYPGLAHHQQLHSEFLEVLEGLVADLAVFGPSQHLADRALEISQDWLIHHIVDEDTLYAEYLKQASQSEA